MSNTPQIEGAKMLTLLADLIIALAFAAVAYIWASRQPKDYTGTDYNDLDGPYPDDYDYDEEIILYDGDEYQVIEHHRYGRYVTSSQGIGTEDSILDDFGYEPRDSFDHTDCTLCRTTSEEAPF